MRESWSCWLVLCEGKDCWEILAVPLDAGSEEMVVRCECGHEVSWSQAREAAAREEATMMRLRESRSAGRRPGRASRRTPRTKTRPRSRSAAAV